MKRSQIVYRPKRPSLRKKSKFRQKFFGGLFFCLIISLIYLFIFSPIFWIENIEIIGYTEDNSLIKGIILKFLEEKIFDYIPQKSIVFSFSYKIQTHLLETFPEIKSISLQRKWPRSLVIEIKKRNPIGIWCQIEKCFYIDDEGVIYQEAPMMEGGLVLTIADTREKVVHLKEKILSADLINFILEIKKQLSEKLNLLATKFEIHSIHDLRVSISEGWQIYFDPSRSSENEINVLERVLKEDIKDNRATLEYIDLRIENRAYYK